MSEWGGESGGGSRSPTRGWDKSSAAGTTAEILVSFASQYDFALAARQCMLLVGVLFTLALQLATGRRLRRRAQKRFRSPGRFSSQHYWS